MVSLTIIQAVAPQSYRSARPCIRIGLDMDRFRTIAPNKEVWMVEQGFSWSSLGLSKDAPLVYPTVACI